MADQDDKAIGDERLLSLARSARAGDRRAAADLLRGLQDIIYRLALSQLKEPDAAHEATQEAALRLLRGIERFEGRSRVTTWALGVTLNVCREQRRKRADKTHPDALQTAADTTPSGELRLEQLEANRLLMTALDDLPPRQREAVTLRYFEGLSVADTAEAMGCSAGAAKASVWQALRRLRGVLSEKETSR